ncbi:MAG: pentapeptide repeat-containing protein [Deinococcales bacterium]
MKPVAIEDGGRYQDAVFTDLKQSGTVQGATFVGCTFQAARVREAAVHGCRFLACSFTECDLSLADVEGSAFRDVTFDSCNLTGVNWSRAVQTLHDPLEVDFRECVLDFGVFYRCTLEGRRLAHCVAHECDFRNAVLVDAVCRGTDFAGSSFDGADLRGADLRRAKNYVIDVRHTLVKGARFTLPEATALLLGLEIQLESE